MKKKHACLIISLCFLIVSCGNNSNSGKTEKYGPEEIEEEWDECEKCDGAGYFTHTCSTCKGSGRLIATYTSTQTRTCTACAGLGIKPCSRCGNYRLVLCQ